MTIDLESRIRERAYALWEQAGRPQGEALAHWFSAEREFAASTPIALPPAKPAAKRRAPAAPRAKRAASALVLHS
jgi:hypothetical protein